MEIFNYVGVMGMVVGMMSFLSNSKHLLSMLISLEYVTLSLFFLLFGVLVDYNGEDYLLLYYLVMVVCEGVLGLGIMVGVVRLSGNDYFSSFNLLKC